MRSKGLATALVASVALLVASAAWGQDSPLNGNWRGTGEKNSNITASIQAGIVNDASVDALCMATTGEMALLYIDANESPDKIDVTSSKATIGKKQKADPAYASVTLPGGCVGPGADAGDQCFDDGDCFGDCVDPLPLTIDLTCDRAKIKNTVKEKTGKPIKMKFKAYAKKCATGSAQAASALTTACANQTGISVKNKDAEITKMRISGHAAPDAAPEIALTLTTADGQGADTLVYSLQPTNNFGNATSVTVKNGDPVFTHDREPYMKFDLTSAPATITDLTLTLTAIRSNIVFDPAVVYTFDLWGLNDGHAGEDWVEGNGEMGVSGPTPSSPITWNNAPGNDPTNGYVIAGQTTQLGTFTISNTLADGEQVVISSPSLLSFVQSDTNDLVTFIVTRRKVIQPDPWLSHIFASKEHSTFAPPTLELTGR